MVEDSTEFVLPEPLSTLTFRVRKKWVGKTYHGIPVVYSGASKSTKHIETVHHRCVDQLSVYTEDSRRRRFCNFGGESARSWLLCGPGRNSKQLHMYLACRVSFLWSVLCR